MLGACSASEYEQDVAVLYLASAITLLAASRAVMLLPSAIVVSPSSDCSNRTTIMSTAVAGCFSGSRCELHHF
jgi:hypothetical protein